MRHKSGGSENAVPLQGVGGMKRFLVLVCMAAALPASEAFAGSGFFWFHTRQKSVLLSDNSTATPQNHVVYRGNAVYPATGRLYFADSIDRWAQPGQQSKSGFMSVFSRGWLTGAAPSKAVLGKSSQTK
jgi:hypothetical protein